MVLEVMLFHRIQAVAHHARYFPHVDALLRHERGAGMAQNVGRDPAETKLARPAAEALAYFVACIRPIPGDIPT